MYFGDQEEMGLGVRVATPLTVKPQENRDRPGRILDDHGRRDEKGTWGEQAAWCDYSGWVGDAFAGIMVMADPGNPTACRWHTRDYGLMVANPFARSAFKKGPAHRTALVPGRPFHLRFGILVHAGRGAGTFDPADAYQDFLRVAARDRPDGSSHKDSVCRTQWLSESLVHRNEKVKGPGVKMKMGIVLPVALLGLSGWGR